MTIRGIAVYAMAACIVLAIKADTAAQRPAILEAQLSLIVGVEPLDGTPGSGLIIAADEGRVRILTARHAIEGDTPIPDAGASGQMAQRPCERAPVEVKFKFDPKRAVPSITAVCSDLFDMAVIEVARPASFPESIPQFAEAPALASRPNYQVFLAGLPEGDNPISLTGEITGRSSSSRLQIDADGIVPGFSGGAVFDRQFRFIGIIISASRRVAYALPVSDLNKQLELWKVDAPNLKGASAQGDNPHFREPDPPDFGGLDARNAIRRYRSAFTEMEAGLVKKAYPSIGNSALSLFGDASNIELVLDDCTDIDPNRPSTPIKCAFGLNIMRRTGPIYQARSCDFKPPDPETLPCANADTCAMGRMVFALKSLGDPDDPIGWQIEKITTESPAETCPKPKSN